MRFCFFALSLTTAALLSSFVTVHAQTAQSLNGMHFSTASVVALVNGKEIPMAAFELSLQGQLRSGAQDSQALREKVRRDLVIQAVLAQEAEKARLDQTPFVAQRLVAARHAVLAQAWQQQWVDANVPTDAELAAEYEALKARTGDKEYQIRQVVVRDETAAKLLLDQLDAGKTITELAQAYSIETVGKDQGGLLPWLTPNNLVAPLNEAVRKAVVGQRLPEPVRTPGGHHVVEVVAERPFILPSLDELRGQIAQNVMQRKLAVAVQQQLNEATIQIK